MGVDKEPSVGDEDGPVKEPRHHHRHPRPGGNRPHPAAVRRKGEGLRQEEGSRRRHARRHQGDPRRLQYGTGEGGSGVRRRWWGLHDKVPRLQVHRPASGGRAIEVEIRKMINTIVDTKFIPYYYSTLLLFLFSQEVIFGGAFV